MRFRVLAIGLSITLSFLGATAGAEARSAPPAEYSDGPPSLVLQGLVEATGGNPDRAGAERFAYLRKLDATLQVTATDEAGGGAAAQGAVQPAEPTLRRGGNQVLADVYADDPTAAADKLRALGMQVTAVSTTQPQEMVEGWLPVDALTKVAGIGAVDAVSAVAGYGTDTGSVLSEGDAPQRGPQARALGPNGAGVSVGVISDTINKVGGGVAGSQGTGDLPGTVNILEDFSSGIDEGRAMAEIIYDEAPGVTQMSFSTGVGGAANKADSIDALVNAGVDVIADDIFYLSEPFFQDGIVSQAAEAATASGVPYFVSAGNRGRQAWEGTYSPTTDPHGVGPTANDFDPGAGTDAIQTIGTFTNRSPFIALQWDEPWGQASTDLAVDVYGNGSYAFTVDSDNIASGLPLEQVAVNITGTVTLGIAIRRVSGTRNPFMKYVVNGVPAGTTIAEHATNSPTINPGAASARGPVTVAAAEWSSPTVPEAFSSRGPARRLFNSAGVRLATPEVRNKPDLTAADGVSTSVTPNFTTFFGTSAAAPSAAGVAALLIDANPTMPVAELKAIMTLPANALACTGGAGAQECGSGFIQADSMVAQAQDPTPPVVTPVVTPANPDGSGGWYTGPVSASFNVSDGGSPVGVATGCGTTAFADGTSTATCSATSAGGTTTRSVTVKRDSSPPSKPKIKGIKSGKSYTKKKLPKKSKVKCTSSDSVSGVSSCKVSGYSKKPGKHKLTATATNGAGLTSKAKVKYTVKKTKKKKGKKK